MNYFDLRHEEINRVFRDDYFTWHSHTTWMMRFERCLSMEDKVIYGYLCNSIIKGTRAVYEA